MSIRHGLTRLVQNFGFERKPMSASTPSKTEIDDLEQLREALLSRSDWLETLTRPPTHDEYALLGKFIQIYCIAEFNARRLLDALKSRLPDSSDVNSYRLNDTDLLMHLRKAADRNVWKPSVVEGLTKALDILEMHRIHRHSFAHWVVRKHIQLDVLVILTMNAREAERRDQKQHSDGKVKFGLMPTATLEEEFRKLQGHCDYMAKLVASIEVGKFAPLNDSGTL